MNLNICAYNISIVKPIVSRLHNELTPCIERANCSSCVHFFFRYFFYTAAHAYLNDYLHCWDFIVFFLFFCLLLFDIVSYHSQECKWRWSVCQSFYQLLFSCWPLNTPQVSLPNPFKALRVTIFKEESGRENYGQLEGNWDELVFAKTSGIVIEDMLVSYWPICFPFPYQS